MIEVHPLAAVFPMMTDDELQDLADDIRENGLLHPIVLDADGVLIDGRNRLRACELAEVEPTFESLNGHDAAAFIVSANLERRNLTVGQRAMALAFIYPDPERGRGNKDGARKGAETGSFSYSRVKQARQLLRHSLALAQDVMAKRTSIDEALKKMEEAKRAGQSIDEKMAELRAHAPDIADMVDDERLTLEAGITELRTRQQRIEEAIDAAKRAVARMADLPVQLVMLEKGVALAGNELLATIDIEAIATILKRLEALKAREAS